MQLKVSSPNDNIIILSPSERGLLWEQFVSTQMIEIWNWIQLKCQPLIGQLRVRYLCCQWFSFWVIFQAKRFLSFNVCEKKDIKLKFNVAFFFNSWSTMLWRLFSHTVCQWIPLYYCLLFSSVLCVCAHECTCANACVHACMYCRRWMRVIFTGPGTTHTAWSSTLSI